MVAAKLLAFSLFLCLVFSHVRVGADANTGDEPRSEGEDSAVIEQLKLNIRSLESHIREKTQEIIDKDEAIADKEKIIKEKSISIVSLENEGKWKLVAEKQVGEAHARAESLEKQVDNLRKAFEVKIKENKLLEDQAAEHGKKESDLNRIVENLEKIIDGHRNKLLKTERALKISEEELMKARFKANSKAKELMEVHGAWLPPWLIFHYLHYQSLLDKNWKLHGKPNLEMLMDKVIEKKARAEIWAAPHLETMKTKWIPAIKERWAVIQTKIDPHVQMLTAKGVEKFEICKSAVTPHIIKVQEVACAYFQELRTSSKPYVDQVAAATMPHVEKLHAPLKPYTQEVVRAYRKFLNSAIAYHHQVQDTIEEKLKNHELTKSFASKKLASGILTLLIIFLLKVSSGICRCCSRTKKMTVQHGTSNRVRRKAKRIHPDREIQEKHSAST